MLILALTYSWKSYLSTIIAFVIMTQLGSLLHQSQEFSIL